MVVTPVVESLPAVDADVVHAFEDDPRQVLARKELHEIKRAQISDPLVNNWRRTVIDQNIPQSYMAGKDLTM